VFQAVVGTNQPVMLFTQQPYFTATHVDPIVTINSPGENVTQVLYFTLIDNHAILYLD